MALEGFNELLHKLREAHERELEGWHEKFQELTNKKGCDTKRMEELFNKNQHLREQQRLLTQNIKQLENRLRAGLCDRCTVTQDVAKRRQQEYETAQIQTLQHISILAGEMNTMRKENHRLQEEVRRLREALEGQSGHSSSQDACQGVRQSADLSPSATPHITTGIRSPCQPPEGVTAGLSMPVVKTELDHSFLGGTDDTLPDGRHVRVWNGKQSFKPHRPQSMSPPILPSLRSEQNPARCHNRQKRSNSEDAHRPSIHPFLVLKNNAPPSSFNSSLPGNDKQSRQLVHTPVPYRPLPVKSARLSIPWPLPEYSDWVTLATSVGDGLVINPNPNSNLAHFVDLQTSHQQSSNNSLSRKPSTGQDWPKPGRSPQAGQTSRQSEERAVAPDQNRCGAPSPGRDALDQSERVFGESLKETDTPLDLSDTGRSKIKSPQDSKPSPTLQDTKEETSNRATESSHQAEASSSTPPSNQYRQSPNNHTRKEEGQSEMEEADGTDKTTRMEIGDKKVPVLTISLRPVVLLEALNSGLQKQLSSNGKSAQSLPSGSSSEDPDVDNPLSGSKSSHGTKRKMDSDTEVSHQKERRMNLSNAVTMEKSLNESDDRSKMSSH